MTGPFNGKWFDYVVVIMMENHSINDTYGSSCFGNCTYYTSLAQSNGLAEQYTEDSIQAGSWGDYIAITSGYGNSSSSENAACNGTDPFHSGCKLISTTNVIDRLDKHHLSWKAYMEDYPNSGTCSNVLVGTYHPNHNPFIYYADIQNNATRCSRIVSANSQLASQSACWPTGFPTDDSFINDLGSVSTASNYMFLAPNGVDDNHDCDDVSVGNAWLNGIIPQILGTSVFKTQRAALFITFDEPGCTFSSCPGTPGGELYTVWASNPAIHITKAGFNSTNSYTHYSMLKTVDTNWNFPSIGPGDGSAQNMQEFFVNP